MKNLSLIMKCKSAFFLSKEYKFLSDYSSLNINKGSTQRINHWHDFKQRLLTPHSLLINILLIDTIREI